MDSFQHTLNKCGRSGVGDDEVPGFTQGELSLAVAQLAAEKVPGPDGIPAEILEIVEKRRPEILLNLYNTCLILIDKGKGGDLDSPSYRPLSLLNTLGKLFKLLLRPRIQQAVRDAGGLNDR